MGITFDVDEKHPGKIHEADNLSGKLMNELR